MDNKIKLLIFYVSLLVASSAYSQAPLGINYQGVARNSNGSPIPNHAISLRVSILNGGSTGSLDYEEIHVIHTNDFGLFAIVIGSNPAAGSIEEVDWSSGEKWLQIEMDGTGGSNFQLVGSQKLLSVPYAMYAAKSGAELSAGDGIALVNNSVTNTSPDKTVKLLGAGTVSISGTYPEFVISGVQGNQSLSSVLKSGQDAGLNVISNLGDPLSEQDAATKKYVDNINVNDSDADPVNEIQDLQLVGNSLSMTLNGNPTIIDLGPYLDNTDNQLLALTSTGTQRTIGISGGNQLLFDVADADSDPINEIQNLESTALGTDRTISISDGNSETINIADNDDDSNNEIQDLQLVGNSLSATLNGNPTIIDLTPYLDNTDNQTLSSSQSGTDRTISISDGNSETINIADNDDDSSNEIQAISLSGNTLSLANDPSTADLRGYLLENNNDANNEVLKNLADPVDPQDAVTKSHLDMKDATDYAFKVEVYAISTGADITFNLNEFEFDEGDMIDGTQVTILENGVYYLVIKGSSNLSNNGTINVVINSVSHSVSEYGSEYNEVFLFKLNSGDVIKFEAEGTSFNETFDLQFFGYKI